MDRHYDLVVLGGGAIGLSAALSAAETMNGHPVIPGHRILIIDQFEFGNDQSSSAGRTRQFRYQYSQPYMTELVMQSVPCWKNLSDRAGFSLISDSGSLWFGHADLATTEGGIGAAKKTMSQLGIPCQDVSAQDLDQRFGFSGLPADYAGFLQPNGGTIDLESTIDVLLRECHKHGIHMVSNERIDDIGELGGQVVLTSATQRYVGASLVIATGPFINETLAPFGHRAPVKIWDMVSCYYPIQSSKAESLPTWFAFHQSPDGSPDLYYGFPPVDNGPPGHMRVCPDYPFAVYDDPRTRRTPSDDDFAGTTEWVRRHMPSLRPKPAYQSRCMLALSTTEQPLFLDLISRAPNVAVCAAGWCAKVAPELGRLSAQLALRGQTTTDITPFRLET